MIYRTRFGDRTRRLSPRPSADPALAISIVRSAIDRGITFMDNCWGVALRDGYRQKVFLMTKFDGAADRGILKAPPDRPHRSDPISRKYPPRRSRPFLCRPGADRGAAGGEESRQDSLHRFYRAQGSVGPSAHAGRRGAASFSFRYLSDAAESDGRALPQF
jgi:hypothetical protein